MSSFGERQLAKFGWKAGSGLGKNEQGISKALSVTRKLDATGIGLASDQADQFFPWWDAVFNKTASSIDESKLADRSEKDTDKSIESNVLTDLSRSSKKKSRSKRNTKAENTVQHSNSKLKTFHHLDTDDLSQWAQPVTDAELFTACQGRTAYKGSRKR